MKLREANLADNVCHGAPLEKKQMEDTRWYWQNTNGFQMPDPKGGTFLTAMQHMRDADVDAGGFNEINLDTQKNHIKRKLLTAVQETSKQCRVQTSSSPIIAAHNYKPGGTVSFLRDDLVSRYNSKGSDPYGRLSYVRLNCRDNACITYITAYQPGEGQPKPESMSVITQQNSIFLKENRRNPSNVRHHFVKDLTKFLKILRKQGDRIILAGDFNDVIGETGQGMSKICKLFDLVDPIYQMYGPPPPQFATWVDGKRVIDYILISKNLLTHVTRCGYEPFLHRVRGDHRGMYIDFNTSSLFGAETTQLATMAKRKLHSSNPAHVTAYFQHKIKYLHDHNFFVKLEELKQSPSDALAERLDRTLLRASLYAEARIPQYPSVPFSPTIADLRNTLGLYRMLLFQHHHGIELHDQIRDAISRQYEHFLFPDTLEECKIGYNSTLQALRKAEKDAVHHRSDFLQKKAESYADSGDATAESYLKRLQQCEDTSRVFKKCAIARGKHQKGGFSTIEVPRDPVVHPKQCTEWRTVDCPKEIETLLLERNRLHFGQAQGTPITVPPLSQEVNFEASTITTDLILNGSYTHEDLDEITQTLIDHLQRVSPPSVDSLVTMEQFASKFKTWRENTSTSPSGQHLGHYKSLFSRHSIPKKKSRWIPQRRVQTV